MESKRQIVAIMFCDIVGYTRMMQVDEAKAVASVARFRQVLENNVSKYNGEVQHYYGDGSLSVFHSAVAAVECAREIQLMLTREEKVPLRIGLDLGEIRLEDGQIFGDGVNIASRIESIGVAGSILLSHNIFQQIRNRPDFQVKELGDLYFKNVLHPVKVYALANEGLVIPAPDSLKGKLGTPPKKKRIYSSRNGMILVSEILVIAIVIFTIWKFSNKSSSIPNHNLALSSIAVLPFEHYSEDEGDEYFTNGLTDELRSRLLSMPKLKVISRSSSEYSKNQNMTLQEISRKLDVEYVLEGNVTKIGDKVKVSVSLTNVKEDQLQWSPEPFEMLIEDIFLIQSEIAQNIAKQLSLELTDEEKVKLETRPTESQEAYDYYARGMELLYRGEGTDAELNRIISYFEKAIEEDPEFSMAHVGLAQAYLHYIFWGRGSPNEYLDMALGPALEALRLDPENGACYGALGSISFHRFDQNAATEYLLKALEKTPNFQKAYEFLGWMSTHEGDWAKAISYFRKGIELDPFSSLNRGLMTQCYIYKGDYDKGLEEVNKNIDEMGEDNFLLFIKGSILSVMERYNEAIKAFGKRTAGTTTNWMLGYAYGKSGNRPEAERILQYLLEKQEKRYVPSYMIATVYISLGDQEKALEYLEKDVFEEGGLGLFIWSLNQDPRFHELHGMERFNEILSFVND